MKRGVKASGGPGLLMAAVLALSLAAPRFVRAAADDPMQILAKTRLNEASQSRVLQGQVRRQGEIIPFRMTLDGGEIKYEFSNPDQTLILQLGEKNARLLEAAKKGGERSVTDAQYSHEIRDTGITYEDLSMHFLYWPVAKITGEEVMLTRNCWKLRVEPGPGNKSQYGYVMLWIEKQSGGLAKVETYDKGGKMLKRFEVRSVQKVEGGYVLKQMRIQKMVDGKLGEPTYLEINNPDKS